MDTAKHTPGPWEVDDDSRDAFMVCHGMDTVVCRGVKTADDARLIAASPELLGALQSIERVTRAKGLTEAERKSAFRDIGHLAATAIAKATRSAS